jgi:hypothetical protein
MKTIRQTATLRGATPHDIHETITQKNHRSITSGCRASYWEPLKRTSRVAQSE